MVINLLPITASPKHVPPVNAPGTGVIYSWDTSIGVDGPGSRFVVFTSGCPLRCVFCDNPESWLRSGGHTVTVAAVMAELARYERFIAIAGGGLTITGGEALAQADFVGEVMHAAKARGIHTALDTSGYLGDEASDNLLHDVDLVLLDIKSWDPATYHRVTKRELEPTLRFARRLADLGRPVWLRFVLLPGWTDDPANVDDVASATSNGSTSCPSTGWRCRNTAHWGSPTPRPASNPRRRNSLVGSRTSSATTAC